jgi:single-strand DNA-binding protein
MNSVNLIGRIASDPELKYTPQGSAFLNFRLAVDRGKKDGQDVADFFNVFAWEKQAENVSTYCHKGSLVGVSGRLQQRTWEKDGQRRESTEVVAGFVQFLDPVQARSGGE